MGAVIAWSGMCMFVLPDLHYHKLEGESRMQSWHALKKAHSAEQTDLKKLPRVEGIATRCLVCDAGRHVEHDDGTLTFQVKLWRGIHLSRTRACSNSFFSHSHPKP